MLHPALVNFSTLPRSARAVFGWSYFQAMSNLTTPSVLMTYATIGPLALACMVNGPVPSDYFPRPDDAHVEAIMNGILTGAGPGRSIELRIGSHHLVVRMDPVTAADMELIHRAGILMTVGAIVSENSLAMANLRTTMVKSNLTGRDLEVALQSRTRLRSALPCLMSLWDPQVELLMMAEAGALLLPRQIRKCIAGLGVGNMQAVIAKLKRGGRIAARWETFRDAIAFGPLPQTMTYLAITPSLSHSLPGSLGRDAQGRHDWT